MAVLYVTTQGATVHRKGATLIVEKGGDELARVTTHDLDAVLIFGRGHLTTDATRLLLRRGIGTAFLTFRGRLLGRLAPPAGKNAGRRMQQVALAGDGAARLALSRSVVESKIAGSVSVLRDYAGNHPATCVREAAAKLAAQMRDLGEADSLDELRGLEGAAARVYFRAFSGMCRGELSFETRTRRPPRDPMNALLSLGYVLVGQELGSLIDAVGLDPYVGLYHDVAYGRPSLALDLLEEFRRPVVDRLALRLNNLGALKRPDFRSPDDGGCLLAPAALERYLAAYEAYLNEPRSGPAGPGGGTSYRRLFRRQVERLAASLDGGALYRPHNRADGACEGG